MRAKLTISAVLIALLILPTLAQSLGMLGSRTTEESGAVATLAEPTSDASITAEQAMATGALPSRGMTMQQVEASHGIPVNRKSPVGDPPITRWEYEGFIVYFEYRHVIHAVAKVSR